MGLDCIITCLSIGVPSLIVNSTVFVLIIKSTPDAMKSYRPYLFHLTVYDWLLSCAITVFYIPEVRFPAVGVKISGVAQLFSGEYGPQHWLEFCCFVGILVMFSLDLCVSYRYYSLVYSMQNGVEFQKTKLFWIQLIGTYTLSIWMIYSLHAFAIPLEEFIRITKQQNRFEFLEDDLINKRSIGGWNIDWENKLEWIVSLATCTVLFLLYTVFKNLWMMYRIHLYLSTHMKQMSEKTAGMHRKLTILVAAQIFYPFCSLSIPVFCILIAIGFDFSVVYGSKIFQGVIYGLVISLPLFNGVTTLWGVTPYRKKFVQIVGKYLPERKKVNARNENESKSTYPDTSFQLNTTIGTRTEYSKRKTSMY